MSGSTFGLIREIVSAAAEYFKYSKVMELKFRAASAEFGKDDLVDTKWWDPDTRQEAYRRIAGLRRAIQDLSDEFEACNIGYSRKVYHITAGIESGVKGYILQKINGRIVEDVNQFLLMFSLYNLLLDKVEDHHRFLESISEHYCIIENEPVFDCAESLDIIMAQLLDIADIQAQAVNVYTLGLDALNRRIKELGNEPYAV